MKTNFDKDKEVTKEEDDSLKEPIDKIKEFGIPEDIGYDENIQFITLIGEIEGHSLVSSDKKQQNMSILYQFSYIASKIQR